MSWALMISDLMSTRKSKTERKAKDRFNLYVKMEGTINGQPRKLVYRIGTSDTDKLFDGIVKWSQGHSAELAEFLASFKR